MTKYDTRGRFRTLIRPKNGNFYDGTAAVNTWFHPRIVVRHIRKSIRAARFWLLTFSVPNMAKAALALAAAAILHHTGRCRRYRHIDITVFPPYGLASVRDVVGALELIRQADPRRFCRIERHVRSIHLGPWKLHGFYRPLGKICGLRGSTQPFLIYRYSSTLIHEATHGLLASLRLPHTRENRTRIEKVCVMEEARFLRRFPDIQKKLHLAYGDMIPNPFPVRSFGSTRL